MSDPRILSDARLDMLYRMRSDIPHEDILDLRGHIAALTEQRDNLTDCLAAQMRLADELRAEIALETSDADRLRAEVERMRPVVEAAEVWARTPQTVFYKDGEITRLTDTEALLLDALRAYREGTDGR